jgi:hypothetical protein
VTVRATHQVALRVRLQEAVSAINASNLPVVMDECENCGFAWAGGAQQTARSADGGGVYQPSREAASRSANLTPGGVPADAPLTGNTAASQPSCRRD